MKSPSFCEQCGNKLQPEVKFCQECGARITQTTPLENTADDADSSTLLSSGSEEMARQTTEIQSVLVAYAPLGSSPNQLKRDNPRDESGDAQSPEDGLFRDERATKTQATKAKTEKIIKTPSADSKASPNTKDLMRFEGEKKSAGVALLLCWILGIFGGHRFYMGRKGSAATMLIVTLISIPLCFIIVGFFSLFAVYIWVIVDLFSVSGWVSEYNRALLARIQSGQG